MALVLLLPPSVLSIGKAGDIVDVSDEKADSLVRGGWGRRLYDERRPQVSPSAVAHREEAERFAANIRDAHETTMGDMELTPREAALANSPEHIEAIKRGVAQAKAGDFTVLDLDDPEFGAMVLEDLAELAEDES